MWFKNLRLYRLTQDFTLPAEDLHHRLSEHCFQPCGSLDLHKYGWVPPLGQDGSEYVHTAGGYIMVCARRQEKVLPAAVVNEHLEEKALAISAEQGRPVGRKERRDLKDEIVFSLLPRAFAKSSLDYAYIAPRERLVVVNAASAKRGEELLSALREALGSLPAVPLVPRQAPPQMMTHWLRDGDLPAEWELGEECELRGGRDDRVVRLKNQDLQADEVRAHLDSGMHVTRLALCWREGVQLVLDEQFALKRLKFADAIVERAGEGNPGSRAEAFDADFAVMTVELTALIRDLLAAFGGVEDDQ